MIRSHVEEMNGLINVIGRQNIYSNAVPATRESVKCELMSSLRRSRRHSSDFFSAALLFQFYSYIAGVR